MTTLEKLAKIKSLIVEGTAMLDNYSNDDIKKAITDHLSSLRSYTDELSKKYETEKTAAIIMLNKCIGRVGGNVEQNDSKTTKDVYCIIAIDIPNNKLTVHRYSYEILKSGFRSVHDFGERTIQVDSKSPEELLNIILGTYTHQPSEVELYSKLSKIMNEID